MPDEKEDPFDSSGESLGYISIEQARVLAIQHAQNNTGFYEPSLRHETLVWDSEGQLETDDFYEIRISFRPARGFHGQAGIERFTIDKTGKVELRQIVRELVREPATEPVSEPVRETTPQEPPPPSTSTLKWKILAGVTALALVVAVIIIIKGWPPFGGGGGGGGGDGGVPDDSIVISIASSITKWEWLEAAVDVFNEAAKSNPDFQVSGDPIHVEVLLEKDPLSGKLRHWNSPTQVNATVRGDIQPTILSPAGTTWLKKLNRDHGSEITTEPWQSLLTTPVVIAMWESRARALNCWPDAGPDCTWKQIRDLAASPEGWGMVGHPEWGKFHFGYAYVGESDVGTQTAVLLCMMGLQKNEGLKVADVAANNECGQAIADVEDVIVHRGTSSPLILKAMETGGPAFLDAVTTYEKNVIGFNRANQDNRQEMLVAIYPQDGTVVANHTFAILNRAPWVTGQQVTAAKIFRDFLLTSEQQSLLLESGLRPSATDIKLGSPIIEANGANPSKDVVVELNTPPVPVVDQIVAVWRDVKKPANIVLVFDKSGSMQGDKISQARNGAVEFVREMSRKDWLAWLPFDSKVYPGVSGIKSEIGEQLEDEIRAITARGGTSLYDAIAQAYEILQKRQESQGDTARYGIVILSDGKDESSETSLPTLEVIMKPEEGGPAGIQVHTIGIGDDADDLVLTRIASFTKGGRYWKVKDTATIGAVYKRISKYW